MDMKKQKEQMEQQQRVKQSQNTPKRKTFEEGNEWTGMILW